MLSGNESELMGLHGFLKSSVSFLCMVNLCTRNLLVVRHAAVENP